MEPEIPTYLDADGQPLRRFALDPAGTSYLAIGCDGWAYWHVEGEADVRVRIRNDGDRLNIVAVAVLVREEAAAGGVRPQDLRSVVLGRLEEIINEFFIARAIARVVDRAWGENFSPDSMNPVDQASRLPMSTPLRPEYVLEGTEPDVGARPDAFYVAVGTAWAAALMNGNHNPAAVIASANSVPVGTVHRWAREARRRGSMAPSSRLGTTRARLSRLDEERGAEATREALRQAGHDVPSGS